MITTANTQQDISKNNIIILKDVGSPYYYYLNRHGLRVYLGIENPLLEAVSENVGGGPLDVLKDVASRVKHFITGREGPSPSLREIISSYGDKKIINMYVCREPIFSELEKIASWLSNGNYDKVKKNLYYDKMFHLFINLELEDGTYIKFEKNEEIHAEKTGTFEKSQLSGEGSKCKIVDLHGKDITLNDLIKKGEELQGKSKFWNYDAVTDNCQVFVASVIKANNLLTSDLNNFIMQNVAEVFKTLPYWSQKITKLLPKLKARLNILFKGVGKIKDHAKIHAIMGGNLNYLKNYKV
jgi:hypothetical protein